MIVMQYKPENATDGAHLALIGKGVTFDTGGISIKPSEGMEKMKYDMAAGAAVIGAMQAIAQTEAARCGHRHCSCRREYARRPGTCAPAISLPRYPGRPSKS